MDYLKLKDALLTECHKIVDSKIHQFQENIKRSQEALYENTKSTAGDKFETGRAMMQADINKAEAQLAKTITLKKVLQTLGITKVLPTIDMGAVVITNKGNFFISVAAGKVKVDDKTYFTMGGSAPLAQEFMGKQKGDNCSFNGMKYEILDVA
jgi:transcription elongation GreA/GreB family factor